MNRITIISLTALITVITSQASMTISIEEVGNDVTFTCTGTANITGMTRDSSNSNLYYAQVIPSTGNIFNWNPGHNMYLLNGELSAYGTDSDHHESAGTTPGAISGFLLEGDTFGLSFQSNSNDKFHVPQNYVSGTQIDGKLTMLDTSFAALGITQGFSYSQTFNSGENLDSVTLEAIPEPSVIALLGIFSGGLLAVRRFFMF